RLAERLATRRPLELIDGPELEAARPFVGDGHRGDGDVARNRIVLQQIEQAPPVQVGEAEVEHDGCRLEAASEEQRRAALHGGAAAATAIAVPADCSAPGASLPRGPSASPSGAKALSQRGIRVGGW